MPASLLQASLSRNNVCSGPGLRSRLIYDLKKKSSMAFACFSPWLMKA